MIIKTYLTGEFLTLANATCRDRRLSPESSGVLLHVLSYSKEFEATEKGLMTTFGIGETRLERIVSELKEYGYLEIVSTRDPENGRLRWRWDFYDVSQKPDVKKVHRGKTTLWNETADFAIGSKQPHGSPQGQNDPFFKEKRFSKGKFKKTKNKANGDGADNAASADVLKASEPAPSPFALIANFCYLVPIEKADFLSGGQKAKIDDAISQLVRLDADFSALPFFIEYWKKDWKSLDKKFQKYQEPRPEQIPEFWFRFYYSAGATERRSQFETDFENGNKKLKGNQNNDFSNFDGIQFEQ